MWAFPHSRQIFGQIDFSPDLESSSGRQTRLHGTPLPTQGKKNLSLFSQLSIESLGGVQAFLLPEIALTTVPFGHFHSLFGRVQSLAPRLLGLVKPRFNESGNVGVILFAPFVSMGLRIGHASGSLLFQQLCFVGFIVSSATLPVPALRLLGVKPLASHALYGARFFFCRTMSVEL
jgi:hypothetical protein